MSHGDWKDMFKAVQNNDFELVHFYIKQGVDINYQHPEYFTTALIESIRLGFINITKLLLQNGADATIIEIYSNKSAKQIATELKNFKALELLS